MNKEKRNKLFNLRLEGEIVELKIDKTMFEGMREKSTKKEAKKIMRIYWKDAKRQERETRCLKANGKTRCNENCSKCSRTRDGQPLSIDWLAEDGMLPQESFSVEAYIEQKELYQALHAAIDMLDEKDRLIILLIFFEEKSERAIESQVGLKQSAINSRKRNALIKLKEILKDFA